MGSMDGGRRPGPFMGCARTESFGNPPESRQIAGEEVFMAFNEGYTGIKEPGNPGKKSPYEALLNILAEAFNQAAYGKGSERHAGMGEPFTQQPICEMARRLGIGGPLYQATKKIYESGRLEGEAGVQELLGAINYIAAAIIVRREKE